VKKREGNKHQIISKIEVIRNLAKRIRRAMQNSNEEGGRGGGERRKKEN
jgi:hypothetical protein